MKPIPLSDLPRAFIERNRAELCREPHPKTTHPVGILAPLRPVGVKPRLRQVIGDGLNKTERAFKEWLEISGFAYLEKIHVQAITLRIANGCRYTPDFIVQSVRAGLVAYEVKGFMRDDAAVKLKVAATAYQWIKFNLVTRGKGGTWNVQEVQP